MKANVNSPNGGIVGIGKRAGESVSFIRAITIARHSWKGWSVLRDGLDLITDRPMTRTEAGEFAKAYALEWGDKYLGVEG